MGESTHAARTIERKRGEIATKDTDSIGEETFNWKW
jgi:hypothetical protein